MKDGLRQIKNNQEVLEYWLQEYEIIYIKKVNLEAVQRILRENDSHGRVARMQGFGIPENSFICIWFRWT
jgi:hypothetical protein